MEENNYPFLGAIEDPRSIEAKAKDWNFSETASAVPVIWEEKTLDQVRFFSRRDQDGSSSCMAQSGVKMLGIENVVEEGIYEELSATPIYQNRTNKPAQGMWQQDCLSLLCKPLACLESQLPSQKISESQINASYPITQSETDTAEMYRASGYSFIPIDIEKIASVIAEGKAVQLMMFFTADEWWLNTTPYIKHPELQSSSDNALRHGICAVDYLLWNGKKALAIEDSAVYPNENGQRIITEDFLLTRCFGAGYLLPLQNQHAVTNKPKYTFTKPMVYGMYNNTDVKNLQDILKYEGYMLNSIPSTGNFLALTAQALKKWQVGHDILDFQNETDLTQIRAGAKTLTALNNIYE